jgi:broad specificity phosphatase PhoE
VFCSPLARAVRTAEIIADAAAPRPRVRIEPGLREIDFGELEGLTLEEVRARHGVFAAQWERGEAERFPGGDSIREFRRGAADAIERCLLLEPGADVLVVAHKGVVRAALERFTARLALDPGRFEIDLGSVSCLTRRDDGWIVTLWNEVPALPPERRGESGGTGPDTAPA